jgi:hypothetical protein
MAESVQPQNPSKRKINKMPTTERLRHLFDYDPDTGILIAKTDRPKCPAGSVIGAKNSHGHLVCRVDYQIYYVHRIAWVLHYGEEPPKIIDHINGDGSDNRIENLRAASLSQNMANTGASNRTTSGMKGAYWSTLEKKWRSGIIRGGKYHHLGWFSTESEAAAAYRAASLELDGPFSVFARE